MTAMEPIVDLANKYVAEISADVEGLRQRAVAVTDSVQQRVKQTQDTIQTLEPQLKQTRDDVLGALQDMSPIENLPAAKLFELFAWTTVLQFGFFTLFLLGAYVFAPFVGLVLSRTDAGMLAYMVLPAAFYYHLTYGEKEADDVRRYHLLSFALAEGALVGFALSARYLSTLQPLVFLTPLSVGLSAVLIAPSLGSNRAAVLGACLGSSVAVQLVFGLGLGLSFPYFLLTVLYAVAGFATLQLFLKFGNEDSFHSYMFSYFVAALLAQGLVFYLFGGAKEAVEQN